MTPVHYCQCMLIHGQGTPPYETVCWLLWSIAKKQCACLFYQLMSTNILKKYRRFKRKSSENLFKEIKDKLQWIEINYGQTLIFNQNLPHGNIVNEESHSRWSFNCRFKGVFTPYADKRIGEFLSL